MHPGSTCISDADHDELSRSPSRVKAESQIPAPVGARRIPTDTRERQFEFGRAAAEPAGQSDDTTGANRGIGLEVARGLAANGARVVLAVRNTDRGETAAAAIGSTSPGASLQVMALDLGDLARVGQFAEATSDRLFARAHGCVGPLSSGRRGAVLSHETADRLERLLRGSAAVQT
jgi:short subunit dehydrogenase